MELVSAWPLLAPLICSTALIIGAHTQSASKIDPMKMSPFSIKQCADLTRTVVDDKKKMRVDGRRHESIAPLSMHDSIARIVGRYCSIGAWGRC